MRPTMAEQGRSRMKPQHLDREIRYERLRPQALIDERARCPLVFLPVAPLEYHGPHLPVGTDLINATECAMETCRRLGRGVVHPPLQWGTERERPPWMLENLGLPRDAWIVGMDFPTATWKSHYVSEQLFALAVAGVLDLLVAQGYRVAVIVNGHGAHNHMQVLDRLALEYTHRTPCRVVSRLAFALDVSEESCAGHADLFETSLLLYFEERSYGAGALVDLRRLPPPDVPLRYPEFSVVDGPGFSHAPHPDRIVQADPRDATARKGKAIFEDTVRVLMEVTEAALGASGYAAP